MRRTAIFLGTVVAALGMVALAAALWSKSGVFLARTWGETLEYAPESQVDDLLDRLAGLGDAAFPSLAEALASSRECVAEGAAKAFRSHPSRWQTLAPHEATRRQHLLAKALADTWPRYGPAARRAASEIIVLLLSRAPPEGSLGDAEFLAACADVLRSDTSLGAAIPWNPTSSVAARRPSSDSAEASSERDGDRSQPGSTTDAASSHPQDASPSAAAPMPQGAGDPPGATEPAPLGPSEDAARLPAVGGVGVRNPLRGRGRADSQSEKLDDGWTHDKLGTANEPRRLAPVRRAGFDDRRPHEGAAATVLKSSAELRQLAGRLHDGDPQQVEAACTELKRCGFSEVELDLARQLTDPDAGVRRALARALPATAGIDAAPWLLELSRDTNADVRFEAITLLVTTGDPALLEQLRRLAQADSDERIQRLADRLARPNHLPEKRTATLGGTRK